jgi:outer membrane biosynthesis protein TonB
MTAMADMRGGFAFSVAAHAVILALLIFGLPYFHPKHQDMPPMISVELVEMGKETTTNKISDANKVKPKVEEEKPAPPTPPPPEAKSAPDPKPEVQPEPKPEPMKMEAPPDLASVDTTVPELKMPDLVVKRDTPPPPKVEPKKEPPKPDAPSFDSVLKNLTKNVKEPTKSPPVPTAKNPPVAATGAQAPISSKLTASENDRLIQQLKQCWNPPAAVKDAQNLIVVLEVRVNPDRTVSAVQVEDQGRMSDPAFGAAAGAAKRALRMPACQVLDLPPEKYQDWQDTEITFDPSQLLG